MLHSAWALNLFQAPLKKKQISNWHVFDLQSYYKKAANSDFPYTDNIHWNCMRFISW